MLKIFKSWVLRISNKKVLLIKSLTIVFAIIAVYFQDLSLIFVDAFQYEGYSYILLIPLLVIYLLYRKRKMLIESILKDKTQANIFNLHILAGFLLCLISLAVYIFGSQTFTPLQYHMISLPLFAAGLILILFNPTTLRQAIFPIVFLTLLTPPPLTTLNEIGAFLSAGSTGITNSLTNFLGLHSWITIESGTPVINVINPNDQLLSFSVDIACSGVYSLVGFLVFVSFFAYIVRDKIWKKIAIIVVGFPLIYLLNVIRLVSIVLIGYHWGMELALEVFHLLSGWILVFLGTLLLLLIAEKIFKTQIFAKRDTIKSQNDASPYLNNQIFSLLMKSCRKIRRRIQVFDAVKIVTVILVTLFLVYIQSPVFALSRGPASIMIQTSAGEQGNLQLFPEINNYNLVYLYRDTDFEEISKQDFSLTFEYIPESADDPKVGVMLEVAKTLMPLHPWEVCLVEWPLAYGYQPVTKIELRDFKLQDDPVIIARYFAFYEQDKIQLVLYYFTTAFFEIDNSTQQKQVKLSFITFLDNPEDLKMMEERLLPFAENTANYWEPLRKWNTITTAISQNTFPLVTVVAILLLALLPLSWIQRRQRFKTNTSIYMKLHPNKQKILDAVKETKKPNLPTLKNIAETHQKLESQPVNKDDFLKNLIELEELGMVKCKIISRQDEPVYVWKTQF